MNVAGKPYRTVWREGNRVMLIDQTRLPHTFEVVALWTHRQTADAIRTMVVRGAGAIGVTAGHAMAQAALEAPERGFYPWFKEAAERIRNTRPTAQDLFYAVERVKRAAEEALPDVVRARQAACFAADALAEENAAACRAIGDVGAPLMRRRDGGSGPIRISTHCNAGWLAFVDWGSALAPIYTVHRAGADVFVWVDETRPRGQGASLTAWELSQEKVPFALIADCATGHFMAQGEVDLVIVGADRIAANGDVANKIGTYTRAVLAGENNIPFYVAAPTSTLDPDCPDGAAIPIEERGPEEVTWARGFTEDGHHGKVRITGEGVPARNPAFDVTPARYVRGIITEVGIVDASPAGIRAALNRKGSAPR